MFRADGDDDLATTSTSGAKATHAVGDRGIL
jgi:hypothetical protein